MINGATLKVTVLIDSDQEEEMRLQGISEHDIAQAIVKSLTLTDIPFRKPVLDIESVELLKYY